MELFVGFDLNLNAGQNKTSFWKFKCQPHYFQTRLIVTELPDLFMETSHNFI